jgi:hypothetical protein
MARATRRALRSTENKKHRAGCMFTEVRHDGSLAAHATAADMPHLRRSS